MECKINLQQSDGGALEDLYWCLPLAMTRQTRLGFLDELRGLAIVAVFVYHAYDVALRRADLGPLTRALLMPLEFGWGGVALFFVISGCCIQLSYATDPRWGAFFRRRLCRIVPAYALVLIGLMTVFPSTRVSWAPFNVEQFLSHLFLVHNWIDLRFLYGVNPSFWTLAVEAQLYVVFPLLVLLVSRLGWRWSLMIAIVLEVGLHQANFLVALPTALAFSPFAFWGSWSLGAAIAQGAMRPLPRTLVVACGVCLVGSFWSFMLAAEDFLAIALLSTAWILHLQRHHATTTGLPYAARLKTVGQWSYSLYLIHQPILFAIPLMLARIHVTLSPWPLFGLCLASWALIAPTAGILYRLVEVPGATLGKTWSHRRTPVLSTVS